jgi:hypothetical protein
MQDLLDGKDKAAGRAGSGAVEVESIPKTPERARKGAQGHATRYDRFAPGGDGSAGARGDV